MTDEQHLKNQQHLVDNPEIVYAIERISLEEYHGGRRHWSVYHAVEELRHRSMLRSDPCHFFKINNNLRPYISRIIMARNPILEGFFETRARKIEPPIPVLFRLVG